MLYSTASYTTLVIKTGQPYNTNRVILISLELQASNVFGLPCHRPVRNASLPIQKPAFNKVDFKRPITS